MSSVPAPPSEEPGARADQATEADGSEPATFLDGWARLMRAVGRELPSSIETARAATRRIAKAR